MKLVKVSITSGVEIYINPDQVAYVRADPMDPSVTWFYSGDMIHKVKSSLPDTVKLLEGK